MATPETQPEPVNATWAEDYTTSPDSVDPGGYATKFAPSTSPPTRGVFNWILNYLHKGVRTWMHRGIPDYNEDESYAIGDCVRGVAGRTWVCIQANSAAAAKAPETETAYWAHWGHSRANLFGDFVSNVDDIAGASKSWTFAVFGLQIVVAEVDIDCVGGHPVGTGYTFPDVFTAVYWVGVTPASSGNSEGSFGYYNLTNTGLTISPVGGDGGSVTSCTVRLIAIGTNSLAPV
jgi:hypothetical protein